MTDRQHQPPGALVRPFHAATSASSDSSAAGRSRCVSPSTRRRTASPTRGTALSGLRRTRSVWPSPAARGQQPVGADVLRLRDRGIQRAGLAGAGQRHVFGPHAQRCGKPAGASRTNRRGQEVHARRADEMADEHVLRPLEQRNRPSPSALRGRASSPPPGRRTSRPRPDRAVT